MLDRKARLNVATFVPAYTLGSASPIVAFKFDGGGRLEIATNAASESAAIDPYTSEQTARRRP